MFQTLASIHSTTWRLKSIGLILSLGMHSFQDNLNTDSAGIVYSMLTHSESILVLKEGLTT